MKLGVRGFTRPSCFLPSARRQAEACPTIAGLPTKSGARPLQKRKKITGLSGMSRTANNAKDPPLQRQTAVKTQGGIALFEKAEPAQHASLFVQVEVAAMLGDDDSAGREKIGGTQKF